MDRVYELARRLDDLAFDLAFQPLAGPGRAGLGRSGRTGG